MNCCLRVFWKLSKIKENIQLSVGSLKERFRVQKHWIGPARKSVEYKIKLD